MMKSNFLRPGLVFTVLLVAHTAAGGLLKNLENKVSKKSTAKTEKKKESKPRASHDIATSSFGSGTYPSSGGEASFLGGFWSWLVAAPFQYQHDDPSGSLLPGENDGEWADGGYSFFPKHTLGQATAPYVRIDYNWQSVDPDTDANDVRVEVGYKLVAFHGRMTRYDDGTDTFDFNQYYGVLRYGGYRPSFLPGTFEFAIGLGVAQINATDKESSGAFTLPIKYHPTDWFGIEFRPAWYRWMDVAVGDYDLSASLGFRFVQLRGGYRWLGFRGVDDNLNGPYAGVSVSF